MGITRRELLKGAGVGVASSLISRAALAEEPAPEVVLGVLTSVDEESRAALIETENGFEEIIFSQVAFFWRDRDVPLSDFRTNDQVAVEISTGSEDRQGAAMMAVLQRVEGTVERRVGRDLQIGNQRVLLTRDSDLEWDQSENGRTLDEVDEGQYVIVRGREVGGVLFAFRIRIVSE